MREYRWVSIFRFVSRIFDTRHRWDTLGFRGLALGVDRELCPTMGAPQPHLETIPFQLVKMCWKWIRVVFRILRILCVLPLHYAVPNLCSDSETKTTLLRAKNWEFGGLRSVKSLKVLGSSNLAVNWQTGMHRPFQSKQMYTNQWRSRSLSPILTLHPQTHKFKNNSDFGIEITKK